MRAIDLKRIDGGTDTFQCYTSTEYHEIVRNIKSGQYIVRRQKVPDSYFRMFGTFDIETTTIPGEKPFGFMYHWQMRVGNVIVYGTRWEEWLQVLTDIEYWLEVDYMHRFIIYIHNEGYEYQFMKNYLQDAFGDLEIFAAQPRKPMKITTPNGFEFRCSYKLTNMSLQKAAESEKGVIHPKAAGDLDYKVLRTPDDGLNLSDQEFGYCIADVVSLYEVIQNRLKNEGDTLVSIPLTSTGYVRRDCRNACRKQKGYREDYFNPCILHEPVYRLLMDAGRGGNTHASRFMSGRIWHNVGSADAVSEYPTMFFMDYPITAFTYYGEVEDIKEFEELITTRACLFRVTFTNLRTKPNVPVPYIPTSKVLSRFGNGAYDNGRVLSLEYAKLACTDIDFRLISQMYEWDALSIEDMHTARYGKLPQALRDQALKYFHRKCELKEQIKERRAYCDAHNIIRENDEVLADLDYYYAKSKNLLNGIFGMAFTNPVHSELLVNEDGSWREVFPDVAEALEKYAKSRNSFLIYAWGCWITCSARAHLQRLIDATNIEKGFIYCDTDSSKYIIPSVDVLTPLNNEIMAWAEESGAYTDVNGHRYYLGVFEDETKDGAYTDFITLGAKKYACVSYNGQLHTTVSGVHKKKGAAELGDIKNFKPGFIFREAGGSTLYYNEEPIHNITINGCTFSTASNIGMVDSTYELGVTPEYGALIGLTTEDEDYEE